MSEDKIVFNATKCSSVKAPTSISSGFGTPSCIALSSYTLAQLTSRYTGKFSSCKMNPTTDFASVEAAITSYLTSLTGFMSTMTSKLNSLKSNVDKLKVKHDDLSDLIIA